VKNSTQNGIIYLDIENQSSNPGKTYLECQSLKEDINVEISNMSLGTKIILGTVAVVAVVATGYAIKKYVWDAPSDEDKDLDAKKAQVENEIARLHGEAKFVEGQINLSKADLVTYSNTRKGIELADLQSRLERQAAELAQDAKALHAMEKRLKLEVSKA